MNPIKKIERAVCSAFELDHSELNRGRMRHVAEARHAVRLLIIQTTRRTEKSLTDTLGLERGTIRNSILQAKTLIQIDPDYRRRFELARLTLTPPQK
jgi:hypothetical protein